MPTRRPNLTIDGVAPVLLGLDPGSIKMGFTVGDGSSLPLCSAWTFEWGDVGLMLEQLDAKLIETIETHGVTHVAYEGPIKTPYDKLEALRKTLNLGGHVEYVCRRRGIPYRRENLFDVKRELTGLSGAKKHQMVAVAEKIGVALPLTKADGQEDAADSLGVWLLLLRRLNRERSYAFDRRIWGARGLLPL